MTRLAQTERAALCDTALEVGADGPTLCEGWTVKDLVVHLVVREGSPAAVGIVVQPLAWLTAAASRRVARRDFTELVQKLRDGPPLLSPYAVPKLDELTNTLELFVHHEDIRRAAPAWSPRVLDDDLEGTLWRMVRSLGRRMVRDAPVGVAIEDSRSGSRTVLRPGTATVTLRGLPSEVTMFLVGRRDQARVEQIGDDEAVERLSGTPLGI